MPRETVQSMLAVWQEVSYPLGMTSSVLDQLRSAIRASVRSQAELSRLAAVPESVISRLVRGERGCSIESAERIASALGLVIALKKGRKVKRIER